MKSLISRKGQINTLGPALITLVIAATFLILGIVILQEMRDTEPLAKEYSSSYANETVTDAATRTMVCNSNPGSRCAIGLVTNTSTGIIIPATNYTQTGGRCVVTETTGSHVVGAWNFTYSCTYGGDAYLSANKTIMGIGTFADFWEIIVLAIVITVVIGLLLIVFGGKSRR